MSEFKIEILITSYFDTKLLYLTYIIIYLILITSYNKNVTLYYQWYDFIK